eukprot:7378935-Prymnesium_polylepis.2
MKRSPAAAAAEMCDGSGDDDCSGGGSGVGSGGSGSGCCAGRGGGGVGCAHGDARVVSARARATAALRRSFTGDGFCCFCGERTGD